MNNNIKIFEIHNFTDELKNAFSALIPQLNNAITIPNDDSIIKLLDDNNTTLVVAQETQSLQIVGMLTIVTYQIPTGFRTWIEDVVVDKNQRGNGIGEKLTLFALEVCNRKGWDNINLTSSPHRVAANNLYKKLGFEVRETNCYRKK